MFGFGLTKIAVLIAVVLAVWYGFKFVGRLDQARKAQAEGKPKKRAENRNAKRPEVEDTVECPVCGAYVVARNSTPCERSDCPY